MELFRLRHPDWQLVLSFFSPSGYQVRKDYPGADCVCYLPLDTPRNAREFLDILRPRIAIFVKYEFWYFYLRELHRRNITTYLICGIFRPEQLFFKSYGGFYRQWLHFFRGLLLQDTRSAELLAACGIQEGVAVLGDARFDRVYEAAQQRTPLDMVATFCGDSQIFVAGSTWPTDEEGLHRVIAALPTHWKFILVPHEIHETHIAQWTETYAPLAVRYSSQPTPAELQAARLLIVDRVGILLQIYHYAHLAYVGGGFGVGIHNTLEPAACGVPVIIGPKHQAFREALELIAVGGAKVVRNPDDFAQVIVPLMQDTTARSQMGTIAQEYVRSHIGVSHEIVRTLEQEIGIAPTKPKP